MEIWLLYALPALIVFAIALTSLLRDDSTPNTNLEFWLVTTLAAILWPITLPSMIRKKILDIWRSNHFDSWLSGEIYWG
ncbi:MAG TPA: hypothetical protein V6D02_01970 [Candidatus Obscuribacterales bacterium]